MVVSSLSSRVHSVPATGSEVNASTILRALPGSLIGTVATRFGRRASAGQLQIASNSLPNAIGKSSIVTPWVLNPALSWLSKVEKPPLTIEVGETNSLGHCICDAE